MKHTHTYTFKECYTKLCTAELCMFKDFKTLHTYWDDLKSAFSLFWGWVIGPHNISLNYFNSLPTSLPFLISHPQVEPLRCFKGSPPNIQVWSCQLTQQNLLWHTSLPAFQIVQTSQSMFKRPSIIWPHPTFQIHQLPLYPKYCKLCIPFFHTSVSLPCKMLPPPFSMIYS